MVKSGARWRDCPAEYGPYTTIYNRFNRWSRQGVWLGIFEALTGKMALISTASIDSSHIKAHRSAAGGKGGPSMAAIDATLSPEMRVTRSRMASPPDEQAGIGALSPGNRGSFSRDGMDTGHGVNGWWFASDSNFR
jgi:hypothetical protein